MKTKFCTACERRRLIKFFYVKSLGCKSGPGLPYSECKTCHQNRTNANRRHLRRTSPKFRKKERASRERYLARKAGLEKVFRRLREARR